MIFICVGQMYPAVSRIFCCGRISHSKRAMNFVWPALHYESGNELSSFIKCGNFLTSWGSAGF
jgi:hypothetical protein